MKRGMELSEGDVTETASTIAQTRLFTELKLTKTSSMVVELKVVSFVTIDLFANC